MGKNYYMVRAMKSSEDDFKVFFEKNVVAVGWSVVNFTEYKDNISELRKTVKDKYYSNNTVQQFVSKKLNEVERFHNIKKGDYIIVPYCSYIVLAEVDDKRIYSLEDKKFDLSNQIQVKYRYENNSILKISRNDLSEGLQRRLRVRGSTVSNLHDFKDEIEKLFNCKSYSYSSEVQAIEQEALKVLKSELLNKIQNGKTNLQTGGIGLEKLVCELMQCEGYKAEVLPKTKFASKADADILAKKEDIFVSNKIFIQVKHHSGYSGKEGIIQIINVLKEDEYNDYYGYFITSASIDQGAKECADNNNIGTMDGEALVEWIVNNINSLSETTKRQLGIYVIPKITDF